MIPSAGPDFGKLLDQAKVLRGRAFPTAMVLPQTFPATPDGSEKAIRHLCRAIWAAGHRLSEGGKLPDAVACRAAGRRRHGRSDQVRGRAHRSGRRRVPEVIARPCRCRTRRQRHRRAARGRAPASIRAGRLHLGLGMRWAARLDAPARGAQGRRLGDRRHAARRLPAARGPARRTIRRFASCTKRYRLPASPTWDRCLPQLSNIGAEHHAAIRAAARALLAHDAALQ